MSASAPDPRFYLLRDAAFSDLELARRLIREDRTILESRSGVGETALHFLAIENARAAVDFLRAEGAKIDTQNDFGDTPLVDAAGLGYLEMCRYLIGHGADFRHVSANSGRSAFSQAASGEKMDVLAYLVGLLDRDEDLNPFFGDVEAELVLSYHKPAAELLLRRGLKKRWPDEEA